MIPPLIVSKTAHSSYVNVGIVVYQRGALRILAWPDGKNLQYVEYPHFVTS